MKAVYRACRAGPGSDADLTRATIATSAKQAIADFLACEIRNDEELHVIERRPIHRINVAIGSPHVVLASFLSFPQHSFLALRPSIGVLVDEPREGITIILRNRHGRDAG